MFIAGWNIPGYLPTDVHECNTLEDAREVLATELDDLADMHAEAGDRECEHACTRAAAAATLLDPDEYLRAPCENGIPLSFWIAYED